MLETVKMHMKISKSSSNWLRVCYPSSTFLDGYRVFIKGFKPLDGATDEETPGSPECCERALVNTATIRSSKSKGSAEREADALAFNQQ